MSLLVDDPEVVLMWGAALEFVWLRTERRLKLPVEELVTFSFTNNRKETGAGDPNVADPRRMRKKTKRTLDVIHGARRRRLRDLHLHLIEDTMIAVCCCQPCESDN